MCRNSSTLKGADKMLVAKTMHGDRISLAMNRNQEHLRKLRKNEVFFCPECQEEVILKIGKKRIPHFAHKKGTSCTESYERESEYHLQGKVQLFKWLHTQGVEPVLEQYEQTIAQRSDIGFVYNGRKYAIEYQCSPIPSDLFKKRTISYQKANITPIWILGGKNIKRKGFSQASLSSFDYLFLRKTPSQHWSLPAFCPLTNDLIFMTHITPISVKNIQTQFSVIKLSKAKLLDLLHPLDRHDFPLEDWRTEIRKWKNTAAFYGTPNNKFFQELYSSFMIPSLLPPAIGLPVIHAPFIETPSIQWQSYIIIDMLKEEESVSIGQILHSFRTRLRNNMISLREIPLNQNNYESAVKEYIELLVATNIVQKKRGVRFKLIFPLSIAENQIQQDEMEREYYHKYGGIILESMRKHVSMDN